MRGRGRIPLSIPEVKIADENPVAEGETIGDARYIEERTSSGEVKEGVTGTDDAPGEEICRRG